MIIMLIATLRLLFYLEQNLVHSNTYIELNAGQLRPFLEDFP